MPISNNIKKINDIYGGELVADFVAALVAGLVGLVGTIGALFCKTVGGVTAVDILLIFVSYLNCPDLHLS